MNQSEINNQYTLPARTAKYDRFRIDLTDLLRHRFGNYPCECHLACAFEALRWIDGLAWQWHRRYGKGQPVELALSCSHGVVPSPFYHKLEFGAGARDWRSYRNGLPEIFDTILLYDAPSEVAAWREKHALFAHRDVTVYAPATADMHAGKGEHYQWLGSHHDMAQQLDAMFGFSGQFLFSPNGSHPEARTVSGVFLHLAHYPRMRWEVRAHYGYNPQDACSWYVTVAEQRPREPFGWFVQRATAQLSNMCGARPQPPTGTETP